ncbi:MAG TPA: cupin domain-containing protein [Sphingomonas sp.]
MPKIDIEAIEPKTGSGYPEPYNLAAQKRVFRSLSKAGGVVDFEANHVILPPGAWSSQRHWHEGEDEFLVMTSGTATLVEDAGETLLEAGDCAAFPKMDRNGHHLIGGPEGASFVVIGIAESSPCHYPDIDLLYDAATDRNLHKDGTPY